MILVNLTPHGSAVLPQWVHRVASCPDSGNISQWMEASRKLYCQNKLSSDDPYQQGHQYHCLPSSFLNETVEFCGRSVPIGPGMLSACLLLFFLSLSSLAVLPLSSSFFYLFSFLVLPVLLSSPRFSSSFTSPYSSSSFKHLSLSLILKARPKIFI